MILDKKELKAKLDQLYDIRKELSEITAKINKTEPKAIKKDAVEGSSRYFPYTKYKIKVEAIDPILVYKLDTYKDLLQKRALDLLEVQIELEKFIQELPTSRLRRIFEYRYIQQYSWSKTSYLIGGNATPDSIRMEHDRFLKEN